MKKYLFSLLAIVSLGFLVSCSTKTNEEKARELIEPEIKSNLIKPESYELAQIKLDSCFSDSQYNPEVLTFAINVAKLYREYKEFVSDAEKAESSMTIYAPSYGYQSAHDKQQYKIHKAEMEKAQRRAADKRDQIIKLYKDNKDFLIGMKSGKLRVGHEFIAWAVTFGYRAETAGGMKTMGGALYYLNKDMTEIIHRFTEDDMKDMQSTDLQDINYEFEDELKEIFGEY